MSERGMCVRVEGESGLVWEPALVEVEFMKGRGSVGVELISGVPFVC